MSNGISICPMSMAGAIKQCVQSCEFYYESKCLFAEALKKIAVDSQSKKINTV